jgi:hypothetical protein
VTVVVHQRLQLVSAIVSSASTNLVTQIAGGAVKRTAIIKNAVAVKFPSIIKFNAADMFHNTIVKHAAVINLNTTMLQNADLANAGFVTKNVTGFQNTIGNILAIHVGEKLKVLLAADLKVVQDNPNCTERVRNVPSHLNSSETP